MGHTPADTTAPGEGCGDVLRASSRRKRTWRRRVHSTSGRHTAAVIGEADRVRRAMKQLGSALGVLEARYCRGGETIDRELGLYTLSMDLAAGGAALKDTVTRNGARVVVAGADYIVIEKTGSREEVEDLFKSLEPFGVMEFVRSGQTTVTKPVAEAMVHETTNIAKASSSDAHGGKY